LLYSDGVSERRDGEGRRMGVEWVSSLLVRSAAITVSRAVRELQNAVIDVSPKPLRDDATIVMIGFQ
jgi:hypothetical protein